MIFLHIRAYPFLNQLKWPAFAVAATRRQAIGWSGFMGVQDVRGDKDLYGKSMKYTRIALADDLASAANILMGETNASIPFVIVRGAPVEFTDKTFSEKDYFISPDKCIYRGIYNKKLKD